MVSPDVQNTINASVANPGTVQVGPKTGMTGGDGLLNTPTTVQAATGVKSFNDPSVPLVQPNSNPNTLSADTAKGWISGMADTLTDRSQPQWDVALATKGATDRANKELAPEAQNIATSERSADLTAKASNVQTGVAGTDYGQATMQRLQDQHQQEQDLFKKKEQDLIGQLMSGSAQGAISASINKEQQLQQLDAARTAASDKALQNQMTQLSINEKLGNIQKTNQTNASDDFKALFESGATPNQAELDYIGKKWNIAPADIALLAGANYADYQKTTAKDAAAADAAAVTARKNLTEYIDSRPLGEPININGFTYYGTGKGNIKTGVEVNKSTGQGLYYEYNPDSHKTTVTPMGTVGFADPNWSIQTDSDGNLWRVSASQGREEMLTPGGVPPVNNDTVSLPMTPGAVQKTNAAVYPDGTTGPTLPGHEANAGQCGAACNYWYGKGLLPDSYGGKQTALTPYKVEDKTAIQSHDTFLMKVGTTGHVGVVGDVYQDPKTGKEMFTVTESNYVPPNQGKLSNTRVMSVDDPRITMFARVPTPNLPPAGGDSKVTLAASGANGKPNFGPAPAVDNTPNKTLTGSELKNYIDIAPGAGVHASDTNAQAQAKVTAWQTAHPNAAAVALTDSQLTAYSKLAPGAGILATDTLAAAQQKAADWQKANPNGAPADTSYQFQADNTGAPYGYDPKTNTLTASNVAGAPAASPSAATPTSAPANNGRPNFGSAKAADKPEAIQSPTDYAANSLQVPEGVISRSDTNTQAAAKIDAWKAANPNALTPDKENAAQQLAHYQGNINDVMKGRTAGEAEQLNKRAADIALSEGRVYDPKLYTQQQSTIQDFGTNGDSGKAIAAASKVLDHLGLLATNAETINKHRGFFFQPQFTRDLNQYIPGYSAAGDVAAYATHTAGDLKAYHDNALGVANEMTKVFSGSGGNESEVQAWSDSADDTNTRPENKQVIQKSLDMLNGQLKAMLGSYQRVMHQDPEPFLKTSDLTKWKDMGFDVSNLERYTLPPPPAGQIRVLDKNGQQGVVPLSEFDPNVYTQY